MGVCVFVKRTLSACHVFSGDPPVPDHGAVVVHVQEGDLTLLLAQYEEQRVKQFENLRDVEPPTH